MSKEELTACLEIMRRQRHDFLNHLQVLAGLLQLGKPEQAEKYLKKVVRQVESLGPVLRLKRPRLALRLLQWSIEAENRGIKVLFDSTDDGDMGLARLDMDEDKMLALVDAIWTALLALLPKRTVERPSLAVSLKVYGGSFHLAWETTADCHLPESPWQEVLADATALARGVGGNVCCQQEGSSWVIELVLTLPHGT